MEIEHNEDGKTETEHMTLHKFMKRRNGNINNEETNLNIELNDNFNQNESYAVRKSYRNFRVKTMKVNWNSKKDSYMHVFIDNTDIQKLEEAKNHIRCQKIMFASSSHEFRTPLNAIINSLDLVEIRYKQIHEKLLQKIVSQNLRQWIKNEDKFIARYLKMGKNSSSLLKSLIEDILNLSKIEAGTFTITKSLFFLKELISDVREIFEYQCNQKRIELIIQIEEQLLNQRIFSDYERLKQVFLNIISNSLKFTFKGSITIQ